jgi:hypothetical protein
MLTTEWVIRIAYMEKGTKIGNGDSDEHKQTAEHSTSVEKTMRSFTFKCSEEHAGEMKY